ncbi:YdcF family protein [Larsenimonas salina]|uniref:YdcF family protein n=1 Tax=Larsenimonas salina TaxID=1295565 RepID=UPI002072E446|nr:YdcF family protein [Larsenimonas salina]MCM5703032.1 YdcF family protein [Larsenimonas salina]
MISLIKVFILPPGLFLVLLLGFLMLMPRYPKLMRCLSGATLAVLWLISTPVVSSLLLGPVERVMPSTPAQWESAGAIVVLGNGRDYGAPELNGRDRTNPLALARLAEGARIARKTGLPILLTGGKEPWSRASEAELMQRSLTEEFGLKATWLETKSADTEENAEFSARLLKRDGVNRVVLVTTAFHMARAQRDFERAGLDVVPAPTGFGSDISGGWLWWAPQFDSLERSRWALHEYMGWIAGH